MNPSTALARVLVDELVRAGVEDVVLAPGSRSAPLALALAAAEQRGELTLHVRVDERSAGYTALGLAKAGRGVPAAVVTTSGTAAVNLHPAVVEASYAGVPLLVLTADRPPEQRGTGAHQTIDQLKVYGDDVRWFTDLGVPRREPGQVRYWRSTLARAVAAAADLLDPGPVHVNVPLAPPLVPDEDGEPWVEPLDGRPEGLPWTVDGRVFAGVSTPIDMALSEAVGAWDLPQRGVVVVGDHEDEEAVGLVDELAAALGWPVISEPSGGAAGVETALRHGPLVAAVPAFADAHVPDLVLTVGRVGLTRSVLALVQRSGFHVAVDPRPAARTADPLRSADVVLAAVPLLPEDEFEADERWLDEWMAADEAAATAVAATLAAAEGDRLNGPAVAREVVAAVPPGGLLVVGASWSARLVEAYGAGPAEAGVLANRGTSGIDGVVSLAWGAAVVHQRPRLSLRELIGDPSDLAPDVAAELIVEMADLDEDDLDRDRAGGPAVALVGDLTFLYDRNGLFVPPEEPRPDLVYVVLDNDGGGIFSQLEQGAPRFADGFERVFGTPHGTDVAAAAEACGVPASTVTTVADLRAALADAVEAGGTRVVVARTGPRAEEAALLRDLQAAVGAAVVAALGHGPGEAGD